MIGFRNLCLKDRSGIIVNVCDTVPLLVMGCELCVKWDMNECMHVHLSQCMIMSIFQYNGFDT